VSVNRSSIEAAGVSSQWTDCSKCLYKGKMDVLLPIGGGDIHWSRRLIEMFGRRRSHWRATDLSVLMLMV
jgi:hypothetical protein